MPRLTMAAAAPPDRERVYFEECAQYPFSPQASGCDLVNAWWLAEASLASYERFGMEGTQLIDLSPLRAIGYTTAAFEKDSTQFLSIENADVLIVAFRGTRLDDLIIPYLKARGVLPNWEDVKIDARFLPVALGESPGLWVHRGFLAAYQTIEPALAEVVGRARSEGKAIWFTGHSLGAALATLAAFHHLGNAQGLYTFGSPRVGNAAFAEALSQGLPHICRFVHHRDAVTGVPPEALPLGNLRRRPTSGYTHVGQLKYITGKATWAIEDGGRALNSLSALTNDAIAHAKQVMEEMKIHFSLKNPGSWPITVEAIADHSPVYYANKIFNAHEMSSGKKEE